MVLLEIIGALFAYGTVKGACNMIEQHGKKAYPGLNNREFDIYNRRNGLKFDTATDINKIAARCGVRPDKYGVLPEEGYKACMQYVIDYGKNNKSTLDFIDQWQKTVEYQKYNKGICIAGEATDQYNKIVEYWNKQEFVPRKVIMHEIKHWYSFSLSSHQARVNQLYNQTILGDLSVKKPLIKEQSGFTGKRIEVWFFKGREKDVQDNVFTHAEYRALYHLCCNRCGFEP